MKTTLARIATLFLIFTGVTALPGLAQAQNDGEVVDEIAAVVGEDLILHSEVKAILQNYVQRNPQIRRSKQELWMDFLNELINQKVLAIHAQRDTTISVTSGQVDQQLDRRIEQMAQQVGGRTELEERYGKSISELRADFREDFRDQILAQQFRARKLRDVSVTPSQVRAWYDEIPADSLPRLPEAVRVAHIVRYPKPSEAAREQAREVLTSIRDSVLSEKSTFEQMARRFSEDENSASDGGRMEDFRLGDLLPEFAAVASRLEEGQISQVFETALGFHIMRLNDRRGDVVDFNHILIEIEEETGDNDAARDFLATVRDSIASGKATFEEMARRHSEQKASARRGGQVVDPQTGQRDLQLERLNPSWQESIRQLEEGEMGRPQQVQLLNGDQAYHLIKLERYEPAHRMSLETDYDRIRQLAERDERQRTYQRWIEKLREDVYVDVRAQPEDMSLAQF